MTSQDREWDARSILEAINLGLPNIVRFLRIDLKNESLTPEAERLRQRYDTLMMKLETHAGAAGEVEEKEQLDFSRETRAAQGTGEKLRRHTATSVPDPYTVMNTPDYDYPPPPIPVVPTGVQYSNFLLNKDKLTDRWRRCWCKVDSGPQSLSFMEPSDRQNTIEEILLDGAELKFGENVNREQGKDHCLVICPRGEDARETIFAAYDPFEFRQWKNNLHNVIHKKVPNRLTRRTTVIGIPGQIRTSPISSFLSQSSGYISPLKLHTVEELGKNPKQDVPLPQLPDEEEEDKSDTETIYEEIDALQELADRQLEKVDLFIEPLRGGKKRKNSLPSFSGFITRLKRSSMKGSQQPPVQPQQLVPRSAINQEEEEYRGYLYKKSSKVPNLWKKKWCVLKHCIFAYYETPDDIEGNSLVLLGYSIESVQEKRAYVFKLTSDCNTKDLYFAADNEEEFLEWWNRLDLATKAYDQEMDDDFACEWMNDRNEEMSETTMTSSNTDGDLRRLTLSGGVPESRSSCFSEMEGVYDVPRSALAPFGAKLFTDPVEGIYSVPRSVPNSNDDDYDYPPDARELDTSNFFGSSIEQSFDSLGSRSSGSSDEAVKKLKTKPQVFGPQTDNGVNFSPGELEEIMSERNSNKHLYSEIKKKKKDMDFSSCLMRGNLFKRERFQWNKIFCAIRGSCFEMYKNDSTVTKHLLPGCEIMEDLDSRRPWSFKLRDPRRDDHMHLAAESASEYQKWLVAFNKGCSIQVQSLNSLESARVIDPAFKERWDSLEHVAKEQGRSRLNTPSSLASDENILSTSSGNRKRKFTDLKSMFRRSHRSNRGSSSDLQSSVLMHSNETLDSIVNEKEVEDDDNQSIRRSLSLTTMTPSQAGSTSQTRKVFSSNVKKFLRGWLKLQHTKVKSSEGWKRCFCVLENLKLFCFTDDGCDELIDSISLRGSRVSRASQECNHEFVFKVWNLNSSRILYLMAEASEDYSTWLEVATNGADYVIPDATMDSSQSLHRTPSFYYFPPNFDYPDIAPGPSTGSNQYSSMESLASTAVTSGTVHYKGMLRRRNDSGKWLDRHCCIKDEKLLLYYTHTNTTPLSALPLIRAALELNVEKSANQGHLVFTLKPSSGQQKLQTFGSVREGDYWSCIVALYEASQQSLKMSPETAEKVQQAYKDARAPKSPLKPSRKLHQREPMLTTPYSKLTNRIYSGMIDVKLDKEPWTKYWCSVTDHYFHIYQTASSQVAIQVTHLPSCKMQLVGSMSRGTYMILLEPNEQAPIFISAEDRSDLGKWFGALEQGIQRGVPEGATMPARSEGKRKRDKSLKLLGETKQDQVMRKFEKDVKKTRKVARKADQSLKQQQRSLMYIQRELDKHSKVLSERAQTGDDLAKNTWQVVLTKMNQIDQVLPYLEKCIKVNRQAELQTIAVLQKRKAEELKALEGGDGKNPSLIEMDAEDPLNSTLTDDSTVASSPRYDTQLKSPMTTPKIAVTSSKPPPMPIKLHRTHTSESASSQASEIFLPKGGLTSPEEFAYHVWLNNSKRPGSAKSHSSEVEAGTPTISSPLVLSPRRFTKSLSSGQPNAVQNGGSRPDSANGRHSDNVNKSALLIRGSGTAL